MTLLLAAETFPLAGAAPDVPPVNWGYNGGVFLQATRKAGPAGGTAAKMPALFGVGTLLKPLADCATARITTTRPGSPTHPSPRCRPSRCPVSVYFSTTADVLVPINQVGARWVQPFEKSQFPDGFNDGPRKADDKSRRPPAPGRRTFGGRLRGLQPDRCHAVHRGTTFPADLERLKRASCPSAPANSGRSASSMKVRQCRVSTIVNMTSCQRGMPFWIGSRMARLIADQLTATEAGAIDGSLRGLRNGFPSRLKHLDVPETERADVCARVLRTELRLSSQRTPGELADTLLTHEHSGRPAGVLGAPSDGVLQRAPTPR